MREIVLDTETTGLSPAEGDRVVEIGAVELFNHLPTGKIFHQYINPEKSMPQSAFEVHGLGDDFLSRYPTFKEIAQRFVDFISGAKLVIHNAKFDIAFLNSELKKVDFKEIPFSQAIDTLEIARSKFPGSPVSLDALCRRFSIDNSAREKHGALLDSEILAEIYLELIGGRQPNLSLIKSENNSANYNKTHTKRSEPLAPLITHVEKEEHNLLIEKIGSHAIWHKTKN